MNLLRKLIPSAALLVLGLVALLIVVGGAFFMIKAGGGGGWGAQAQQDPGNVSVKANGSTVKISTVAGGSVVLFATSVLAYSR